MEGVETNSKYCKNPTHQTTGPLTLTSGRLAQAFARTPEGYSTEQQDPTHTKQLISSNKRQRARRLTCEQGKAKVEGHELAREMELEDSGSGSGVARDDSHQTPELRTACAAVRACSAFRFRMLRRFWSRIPASWAEAVH